MTVSPGWLVVSALGSVALEQAVVRAAGLFSLSYAPLSGEHTDSVVYRRSLFTPSEATLRPVWAGLLAAAVLWWAAAAFSMGWLAVLGVLAWLGATAWDIWTWERVAASVKFVSWRRGWEHSARRVPISRIHQVHVVERPTVWRLGLVKIRHAACYIALEMDDGKAIKLPRTSVLEHLSRVEDVANFVRLQMQVIEDTRKRVAGEKRAQARRTGKPVPAEADRELRKRLLELRQQAAAKHH